MTECPFCGASPVQDDVLCPGSPGCGSLEGIELHHQRQQHPPPRRCLFGYDWANGYVAPFLGVDCDAVSRALSAASAGTSDTLVDLGSGDGRIVRTAAAQFGCTAVGVELDGALIQRAHDDLLISATKHHHANNHNNNLRELVTFRQRDLLTVDLHEFTIVTVFLLPETLHRLVPRFRAVLERGGRIISFGWKIHPLGTPSFQYHGTHKATNNDSSPEGDGGNAVDTTYGGLLTSWFVYLPSWKWKSFYATLISVQRCDRRPNIRNEIRTPYWRWEQSSDGTIKSKNARATVNSFFLSFR